MIVHSPELTVGTLPANVNIPLLQFPRSAPALDTVGVAKFLNCVVDVFATKLPLLTVHCNTVGTGATPFPAVTPVTVVTGEFILVIEPGPLRIVQVPMPVTTGVAASVNVAVEH